MGLVNYFITNEVRTGRGPQKLPQKEEKERVAGAAVAKKTIWAKNEVTAADKGMVWLAFSGLAGAMTARKVGASEKRFVHQNEPAAAQQSAIANWLAAIGSQLFNELTHKALTPQTNSESLVGSGVSVVLRRYPQTSSQLRSGTTFSPAQSTRSFFEFSHQLLAKCDKHFAQPVRVAHFGGWWWRRGRCRGRRAPQEAWRCLRHRNVTATGRQIGKWQETA